MSGKHPTPALCARLHYSCFLAANTISHSEDSSASLTSHRLPLSVSGFLPVMDLFLAPLFSLPIVIVKLIFHPWLSMYVSSGETRLIACD